MPSHFTLRMQFGLHQDAEWVKKRVLEIVRKAPVDEIMFFFYAEEMNNAHETLDEIREWIGHSRPWREALAAAGVAVSLNPWHTILHGDRGRRLKPGQDWQTLVDPKGRAASAQVCPMDEGWQRYFDEVLGLYAKEGFRVVWIDDDVRMHNHLPLEWGGCWCALHVAEFARRAGTNATREEIVANCTAAGEPHPWRAIWMDMMEDMYVRLITRWRKIVEAGGTRLGLMSSLPEAHAAEGRRWADWWRAFGGEKPPVHRPHFWSYSEALGRDLVNSIALLDQNRRVQPEGTESGPEVDNGPYGPWNKSFRQTGAAMSLAHILGSTNLNISLYDFMGNDPHDEPERLVFLSQWRATCDWLADEFPMNMRPVGAGVPWNEDMGRRIHTSGGGWASLECPTRGWAKWLGTAGHAFTMGPSPTVNAIGGPVGWSFSDEEIAEWLRGGVLLDGPAAAILVERGFGELVGMRGGRFITLEDALYSVEHCTDGEFALRAGAQMPLNAYGYAAGLFQGELEKGARVRSDLRGPKQDVVGHGLVTFENRLGGRVAVFPWSANGAGSIGTGGSAGVAWGSGSDVLMNTQRAGQLRKVLAYLDPKNAHGWVEGQAYLVPQFLTNGKKWRGVVWNANADEVRSFRLHKPAGMPTIKTAVQVDAHGKRRKAKVGRGGVVELPRPLYQWEYVVVM